MRFDQLHVNKQLIQAINTQGIVEMTEIQERCLPEILAGKDVVGQSGTGSGKTIAFGLPILEKVVPGKGMQALILTPTRELCVQVCESLYSIGRAARVSLAAVYGGVGIGPQINAIRHADIVVGTPGRIQDHMERRTIDFSRVRFLVLDEADRMCDMGFRDDIERIIKSMSGQRQTLLFSATMTGDVDNLMRKHMRSPVTVKANLFVDRTLLSQSYYDIENHEKFSLLVHLLKQMSKGLAIVFCGTRREVDVVAKNLHKNGIHATGIHGGLPQNKRTRALDGLRKGHLDVLVATDVAARGIDVRDISHVFNYDVPKTPEEYVHRIGRTARAGDTGDAVTLVTRRDYDNFGRIMRHKGLTIARKPIPTFERSTFDRHGKGPHAPGRHEKDRFESRMTHRQRGRGDRPLREAGARRFGGEQRGSYGRSFGSERREEGRGGHAPRRQEGRDHSGPRREEGKEHSGPRREEGTGKPFRKKWNKKPGYFKR